ncbi:hypothetical protein [Streptomyces flaveolus]|uniref:hypothetical protein n=1 Tax=Streptomyces flaveolus TaxID=67297 RepID=UPI0036FA2CFF
MRTCQTEGVGGRRQGAKSSRSLTILPVLATLTASIMVVGCSHDEEDRDYAVPDQLCGMPVAEKELTPFLPAGNQIKVSEEDYSGTRMCMVTVDRTLVLTTTQAWIEQGRTTAYFIAGQTLKKIDHSIQAGRFWFSGNEGFGKTRDCVDRRYKQELYVAIQAQGSKHSDPDAMKRLITSYAGEVEGSAECMAGSQDDQRR